MACKWRIRHKMTLGMVLLLAIMAVLIIGTVKGLQGYHFAMRAIDSKLDEQKKAHAFQESVNRLLTFNDFPHQAMHLKAAVHGDVRARLDDYRAALARTVDRGRALDSGFHESELVKACATALEDFDAALEHDRQPVAGATTPDLLAEGKHVRRVVDYLRRSADDLLSNLIDEMAARTSQAQREQRVSLIILFTTSVAAVLSMIGMLRFLYRWVVKPIRLLEQGVSRVARGDFEHRLVIRSGDEIERFADAYNDMAGKLNDMYRDLAQQVNERSRQLVRSERLAGVGFLAAGVAHEINNPLASIAFCSEALESRLGELFEKQTGPRLAQERASQDREIVQKYLKMIQEEAFRCKEITQKLLAFSRGGDRRRERTDLNALVQSVLDMVQHVPNSKGKTIVYQPAGNQEAWVNGQEIKQVMLNLVVNALDSMDEGGTLTIEQAMHGELTELSFKDSGCGMTDEILENIFEPFFTRSRTGKGTGLGLSISHRIITQHGGEIEATSAGPGKGSTFIMRLPMNAPASGDDGTLGLDPEEEFLKLSAARQQRRAA